MQWRENTETCWNCKVKGHKKWNCPSIQCYTCGFWGHIRLDCAKTPPSTRPGIGLKECGQKSPTTPIYHVNKQLVFSGRPKATDDQSEGPLPEQPSQSQSWNYSCSRPRSYSSSSSRASSSSSAKGNNGYAYHQSVYQCSDVRAMEAVNRVANTIFTVLDHPGGKDGPVHIFKNKPLEHFQEKHGGVLFIPESVKDLQRGDLDVLILTRNHGYHHIEVKAFGDEEMDEATKLSKFKDTMIKAMQRLKKGDRALQWLQVKHKPVNIINTLAFPNLKRDWLRSALSKEPHRCKELRDLMKLRAKRRQSVDLSNLCICADDLPAKNEIADAADQRIRRAVERWWTEVTRDSSPDKKPSDQTMNILLARLMKFEEGVTLSNHIRHTGDLFEAMITNEKQHAILQKEEQYLYLTGIPGCGKTLVLANKVLQWLKKGEIVICVFKDGHCTTQPASGCLVRFLQKLAHQEDKDVEKAFPKLHLRGLTTDANIQDFIDNVISLRRFRKNNNSGKSAIFWLPRRRPAKEHGFILSADLIELQNFFPRLNINECKKSPPLHETGREMKQNPDRKIKLETGRGMNFVFDEFTRRTIKGKRAQLIAEIMKQLPKARIWCAGPFPTDKPQEEEFHMEQLLFSYRCPPKIQCLLRGLELFCQGSCTAMYEYSTTSTKTPLVTDTTLLMSPFRGKRRDSLTLTTVQHMLPSDGTDPIFISHAGHTAEIMECKLCVSKLVDYLKNVLQVARSEDAVPGGLSEKDVVIILTGIHNCNNMSCVYLSELYRQLTGPAAGYSICVYEDSHTCRYDPHSSQMSLMHVRAVSGVEKKVVVFVPCRQHQAKPADPASRLSAATTYADAVRGGQASFMVSSSIRDPRLLRSDRSEVNTLRSDPKTHPGANARPEWKTPPEGNTDLKGRTSPEGFARSERNAHLDVDARFEGNTSCQEAPEEHVHPHLKSSVPHSSLHCDSGFDYVIDFPPLPGQEVLHASNLPVNWDVMDKLRPCACIPYLVKVKLSTLGALNLHWLWYTASRSLSTCIIFHY